MDDRLWTVEEYRKLPADDGLRHELSCGVLVAEPRPELRHARVQTRLLCRLYEFVRPRRLGAVLGPCGFVLARTPDTVRGPDVSFVRAERFEPREPEPDEYFPGSPDLAAEIVSNWNRIDEMHAKVADYLAAGSNLVWVVDAERERVTTYRSLLAPRRLGRDDVLGGEDVLPGFSVPVADLLAR